MNTKRLNEGPVMSARVSLLNNILGRRDKSCTATQTSHRISNTLSRVCKTDFAVSYHTFETYWIHSFHSNAL